MANSRKMIQFTRQISQINFLGGYLLMITVMIMSSRGPVEVLGCVPKLNLLSGPCCYHVSGLDYCPDGNQLVRGRPYCGKRPCYMEPCRCYEKCQSGGWYFALFKDANFSGEQASIVKDQETKCVNLEKIHRNWATSVNANDKCVRIYSGLNCQGESTELVPYFMGTYPDHKNLTECGWNNRIMSVGKCEYRTGSRAGDDDK